MACMCWICWGNAQQKGIYGDWHELECPGCGRYKISRSLWKESQGKVFDVQHMRGELERWRSENQIPVVSRQNAYFMSGRPQYELTINSLAEKISQSAASTGSHLSR